MYDDHEKDVSKSVLHSDIITEKVWDTKSLEEEDDKPVDRPSVVSSTTEEFSHKLNQLDSDFNKKAGVGFDAVYSPYSTFFGASGFPHFEVPTQKDQPNSLTLNPFNPNNGLTFYYAPTGSSLYGASITGATPSTDELAFSTADGSTIVGTGIRLDNRKGLTTGWLESGHNIEFAVKGTGDFRFADFNDEYASYKGSHVEVTNIRDVGLRSPMVVTGWGFDLNGNPVPADTGDNTKFASGAFSDMSNWKSGPVDLRWDDERKVWEAGGGSTEIMKFTVDEIPPQIGQNATACEFVHTTVNDIGCSSSVNAIGDTGVKVYDDDLCFFNLPVTLLRGLKGTAERFVNPFANQTTDTDCILDAAAEGACRWVVTGLCCNEEIVSS